jgi:hypothetical protein
MRHSRRDDVRLKGTTRPGQYNRAPLDRHDTDLENDYQSNRLEETDRAKRDQERSNPDSNGADRERRIEDRARCVVRLADGGHAAFQKAGNAALRAAQRFAGCHVDARLTGVRRFASRCRSHLPRSFFSTVSVCPARSMGSAPSGGVTMTVRRVHMNAQSPATVIS